MSARIFKDNQEFAQVDVKREKYSDFLNTFLPHPHTKQITRKTNVDAVKSAIRNFVLTNKYERLRQPMFGSNIRNYLFENFSPDLEIKIETELKSQIEQYEPRAKIEKIDIQANEDRNTLNISILFYVIMNTNVQRLDLSLYRVR